MHLAATKSIARKKCTFAEYQSTLTILLSSGHKTLSTFTSLLFSISYPRAHRKNSFKMSPQATCFILFSIIVGHSNLPLNIGNFFVTAQRSVGKGMKPMMLRRNISTFLWLTCRIGHRKMRPLLPLA